MSSACRPWLFLEWRRIVSRDDANVPLHLYKTVRHFTLTKINVACMALEFLVLGRLEITSKIRKSIISTAVAGDWLFVTGKGRLKHRPLTNNQ
jgi:hypothetical protein